MNQADIIREHCASLVNHARSNNEHAIVLHAGDIHSRRGLGNQFPAVTSVLGSERFERDARVKRIAVDGPTNGANGLFVYRLK